MGESIPDENFLIGNFPREVLPWRSLTDGNFPGGNFPDTMCAELKNISIF